MAFSTNQARQLKAKLSADHVKSRTEDGATLNYIEGWHAISEANRIFGYDAWDRHTVSSRCVWTGSRGRFYMAAYTTKVRISVRAGDIVIVREGSGSGESKAPTPGQAHEIALKSAETDATKRALATFGNPFGLALYDSAHSGVRPTKKETVARCSWALRSAEGKMTAEFQAPTEFANALKEAMRMAPDIESLFVLWEHNLDTVRALHGAIRQTKQHQSAMTADLVGHLKECAVALAAPNKIGINTLEKDAPAGMKTLLSKHANGAL